MKNLFITLVVALCSSLGMSASVQAATHRYWDVQIMTPSVSSSKHTLNVAYNVLSTDPADVYNVSLLQNGSPVGTQNVSHANGGNSGVFSLNMPNNGLYTYQISAVNTSAGGETKTTTTKSINIVDGPTPVVTTINSNNGNPATVAMASGQGAPNGAHGNENPASNSQSKNDDKEGSVTDKAASTKDSATALGAKTQDKVSKTSNKTKAVAIGAVALVLVGAGAYRYFIRTKIQ